MGVFSETFETAITWERLDAFVEEVGGAAEAVLRELCGAGSVTVRLTHAYADGAAPYFTCLAPVERGEEVATFEAVKRAASDAIIRARRDDHPPSRGRAACTGPWYDQQRPEPFAAALRAAKSAVDPGRDPQPRRAARLMSTRVPMSSTPTRWSSTTRSRPTRRARPSAGCELADFPHELAGKIAVIQRGTCDFGVKAKNAQERGALGVIIFNEGTLGDPERNGHHQRHGRATTASRSRRSTTTYAGGQLLRRQPDGVDQHRRRTRSRGACETRNVIAATEERPDRPSRSIVGAHLDSVPEGPGINDDGSGVGQPARDGARR